MFERLTENWLLKLLSLVFALILWFFVIGERQLEVGYVVPLQLKNLPSDLIVANEVPSLVDVRLSGPRTLLMRIGPKDINLAVDLKDLKPGVTSFRRLDDKLDIPTGVKVSRLSPSFVDVKLDRIREKKVELQPNLKGTPPEGFRIVDVRIKPTYVTVHGAESELKDVNTVLTEPIELSNVQESFTMMVPVDYRGKYTKLKEEVATEISVTIEALPLPLEDKKIRSKTR